VTVGHVGQDITGQWYTHLQAVWPIWEKWTPRRHPHLVWHPLSVTSTSQHLIPCLKSYLYKNSCCMKLIVI